MFQVYLFISAQRVAGCLVAEPLQVARKILSSCVNEKLITDATKGKRRPTTLQFGSICFQREVARRASSVDANDAVNGNCSGAIFCENEVVPVACGIRAIWVSPSNRRKHIATRLLDAVR
uniref:N-acetyltransferase ESCO acetyl-transferase domain-containing protein n=1 Tax=Kalanchoe fedtschenkoi TaxID=63787 RepID=A0A7N0T6B3_KALFE